MLLMLGFEIKSMFDTQKLYFKKSLILFWAIKSTRGGKHVKFVCGDDNSKNAWWIFMEVKMWIDIGVFYI